MVGNGRYWNEPMHSAEALKLLAEVSSICSTAGPESQRLHRLVQDGKLVDVIEAVISPEIGRDDYLYATQIQALYKKSPWLDLGFNPLGAAFDAFLEAEILCERTNRRLESERPSRDVSSVLYGATRKIALVLGDVPPLASLLCRYGPGANTSVRKAAACMVNKLEAKLQCSQDMLPALPLFLEETPDLVEFHSMKDPHLLPLPCEGFEDGARRHRVEVDVVAGKLTFVPKSAKTHRPIVIEPSLNGLWQLGVGSYLKSLLRARAGIDLYDQERNRSLARRGSVDGSIATIDLTAASDTVSMGLVFDLLPFQWAEFLGSLRSGDVVYNNSTLQLEKFSSMGNGFTFELESLIFWALARAATEFVSSTVEDVSVYGDDIIIPTPAVDLFLEVLDWCGFLPNRKKSFWSGSFRESCGADWLGGNDVRPFFVKEELSDEYLYVMHNWFMRRGETSIASVVKSYTNADTRLFGPDGFGDGHLIGDFSLRLPRRERRRGFCGGYFDTYANRLTRSKRREIGFLVPGYSVYLRSGAEGPTDPWVTPGVDGYERRSIYTFRQHIFY